MAVSAWTKHLKTEDEKKQYLSTLRRAHKLFDHILELIEDNQRSLESQEISPKAYDSPNWSYRQAHSNGYKQCLRDFKQLFTLDHEEKDGRQPTLGRPVRTTSDPE